MNNLNRKNNLYDDIKMITLQHQLSYLRSKLNKEKKELEGIKKELELI